MDVWVYVWFRKELCGTFSLGVGIDAWESLSRLFPGALTWLNGGGGGLLSG